MATIKFSEFPQGNITAGTAQVVGLEGSNNVRFTPSDLVNGLATVTYVDAQDTNLQNQITQNTNDIANIDIDVGNIEVDTSEIEANITILQGNVVVLEGGVAALQNNVSINSGDITVIQGNIVAIENELANITDLDQQNLSWNGTNANLSISNGNNVVLQEVLDNASNIASAQLDIINLITNQNAIALNVSNNSSNIAIIQTQISELEANGNIQTLSLDNSSNVLSISGGNSVDFTTVLANVIGADAQTLSWDEANSNISISGGNTVTLTGLGGGGNYSNANVLALGEAGWAGNIIPSANITYDLGTATNRWKDLYLSDATIYLGDKTISLNNEGTMVFSGNISAQNIIDETSLIIHGGVINTSQEGTTDGFEWEAYDDPAASTVWNATKVASNGSGILCKGESKRFSYSLDDGETWNILDPKDYNQLDGIGFNNCLPYYISATNTFILFGAYGYYFTTQDFQTYTPVVRVTFGGWNGPFDVADDGTTLILVSSPRTVHRVPVANVDVNGWTASNNGLSATGGAQIIHNGTAFVVLETSQYYLQTSTDGITWNAKVAPGASNIRKYSMAVEDSGNVVITSVDNQMYLSTDNCATFTTIDISSQVDWGATTDLMDIAYGDGLWLVSGKNVMATQYASQDLTTWFPVQTNAIGVGRNMINMSYTGSAFYGGNQDGEYRAEWPVGKQLLLFNSNVVATRADISYAVSSAKSSSAEHVNTRWLTIYAENETVDANANISNISHGDITFNTSETSLDITANAQPVARITSGVLVQVHGSWDATAAGSFNWATDEIASHGISTVTRDATGIYTVEFETPFATNAYTVTTGVGSTDYSGTNASPRQVSVLTRNAANCTVICERTDDSVNEDNFYMSLMVCGVVATQ